MTEHLTRVEIMFYPEYVNHWLRFGDSDADHDLDRRRALALFRPGRVFGYVRWYANDYGTQDWRIGVVQTGGSSGILSRFAGVFPGGDILLEANGNTKVKQVLAQLDAIEDEGFDLHLVSPAYYRHLHNRIMVRRPVRLYSKAQHEAHLAALAVSV
ncbi:DUF2840 domain-containing protein [uncultured Roseobacter sp.]|uniref:DUF2840 domain-containing protein n=1 Tax=uncultured Roseobacter sp. TaxID=114847 RepID=UPI00262F6CEA|nr:DUF2840 domain-containing protein [uncultured Roseobacter sp.]